ncbi:hypothetical protein [Actinoplanes sp. ATCC 53533]|uniref:hypothetical protein n=1 Tax=Actinoplanes sp. ATCC 53533 TaxID=1288362 RepID=UPI0018F40BEF
MSNPLRPDASCGVLLTVKTTAETLNAFSSAASKAPRDASLSPWAIGRITAAALVILHIEHGRTT